MKFEGRNVIPGSTWYWLTDSTAADPLAALQLTPSRRYEKLQNRM